MHKKLREVSFFSRNILTGLLFPRIQRYSLEVDRFLISQFREEALQNSRK